jgi:hypothetical protein
MFLHTHSCFHSLTHTHSLHVLTLSHSLRLSYTHTRSHYTCSLSLSHTHTHAHTHTCLHTHIHVVLTLPLPLPPMCMRSLTYSHAHAHAHSPTPTHSHSTPTATNAPHKYTGGEAQTRSAGHIQQRATVNYSNARAQRTPAGETTPPRIPPRRANTTNFSLSSSAYTSDPRGRLKSSSVSKADVDGHVAPLRGPSVKNLRAIFEQPHGSGGELSVPVSAVTDDVPPGQLASSPEEPKSPRRRCVCSVLCVGLCL